MAAQEAAIDAPPGITVSFSGKVAAADTISGGEGQDVLLGGTFTETDADNLAGWVERTTVVEYSEVVETTVVNDVATNMADQQIRRLPVLNEQKRLVGILSLSDLATSSEAHAQSVALSGISQTGGAHNQCSAALG